MSKVEKGRWTRHRDDAYGAYYWYNDVTKESKWDDTDILEDEDDSSDAEKALITDHSAIQHDKRKVPTTKLTSGFSQYLQKMKDATRASQMNNKSPALTADSPPNIDELCFVRFQLCSAVVLEAPLCICEGICRCIFLFLVACFFILQGLLYNYNPLHNRSILGILLRDFVLTLTAIILLAIPGYIITIYRDNQPHRPWSLRPLVSWFGSIDPRRFASITILGFGRVAANSLSSQTSHLSEIYPTNAVRNNSDKTENIDQYLDGWSNSIFFLPKDVIKRCQLLLHDR